MAQITGHEAGKAYHKIVNAHIYEDQLELMRDVQLKREPYPAPKLHINPEIKSLEDIETWVTLDDYAIKSINLISLYLKASKSLANKYIPYSINHIY